MTKEQGKTCKTCKGMGYLEKEHGLIQERCPTCKGLKVTGVPIPDILPTREEILGLEVAPAVVDITPESDTTGDVKLLAEAPTTGSPITDAAKTTADASKPEYLLLPGNVKEEDARKLLEATEAEIVVAPEVPVDAVNSGAGKDDKAAGRKNTGKPAQSSKRKTRRASGKKVK